MPEEIKGLGDPDYPSVMARDDVSVPEDAQEILVGICGTSTDEKNVSDATQEVFADIGFNILIETGFPE